MQKVAAYCRVSTDKEDQINSLRSQRSYFSHYIRQHKDWSFAEVYYDEGVSGTQAAKRPGFHRMIHDALEGKIDIILTKEVSRFARNTVDALSFTRMLKERHIGVIFTLDNIDTRDGDGELRLTIMASLAQEESRKISERIKWGQKRKMEQGVVFGRNLLGYTVHRGVLMVCEPEAAVVRAIFHKYTVEGKSARTVARELSSEGISPKYAARWSPGVILKILRNEKYAGDLCQKKTITPDYLTHSKKYNQGEEEFIRIHNHHVPIVSRELWEQTQRELKRRCPRRRTPPDSSFFFQNSMTAGNFAYLGGSPDTYKAFFSECHSKLRCGNCGAKYSRRTKRRKDGSLYEAWRCPACPNPSISLPSLLTCLSACYDYIQKQGDFSPRFPEDHFMDQIKYIFMKQNHNLYFRFFHIDAGIYLHYQCRGRKEHFQTDILSVRFQEDYPFAGKSMPADEYSRGTFHKNYF